MTHAYDVTINAKDGYMSKLLTIMSKGGIRLPYSLDFSALGDGDLPGEWTGATWAISSGVAVNTPTVGSEILTPNNDFSAWTGDNPDNWSIYSAPEDANNYVTENPAGQAQIYGTDKGDWGSTICFSRHTAGAAQRTQLHRRGQAAA
jgi:hypothetical protein